MNPMDLLSLKGELEGFDARHPKVKMFLQDVPNRLDTGSVLEISVTDPNGQRIRTNFVVTGEDKQLLAKIGSLVKK